MLDPATSAVFAVLLAAYPSRPAMPIASSSPTAPQSDAPPAPEKARAECTEAALALTQARIAALEGQLAATAKTAQRPYAQLIALVQALQVGLVLVDPEGQIQFVNPHFWELFGLAPRAIPGPGAPPLVPADVFIDGAFENPAVFGTRARALHAAGQTAL